MGRLISLELLKIHRRPLTWVLLALLILAQAVTLFGGYAVATSGAITFLNERGEVMPAATVLPNFVLPGAIRTTMGLLHQVGGWLIVIITAVIVGMEESYGTQRIMLSTGLDRAKYLLAKLGALVTLILGMTLVALGSGTLFALMLQSLADAPIMPTKVNGSVLLISLGIVARTVAVLLVPMLIAFCATILSRSQILGIAFGLGYFLVEALVERVFVAMGEAGAAISAVIPGVSVQAIMALNRFNDDASVPGHLPPPAIAATVLVVYGVLMLFVSMAIFRRRDLTTGNA